VDSFSRFSQYDILVELCEIEYQESHSTICGLINYDDVDAFLDFWSFGGEDAMISTIHPSSGQFSYHIKNGNGPSSSIISRTFSTSGVGQLKVDFTYTAISMEVKEFFSLELSLDGGSTYNRYKSWISGEFENGILYRETLAIPLNSSVDNIIMRFTNYANSQYDHVYLDDIKIEFCEDTSKRSGQEDTELVLVFEKDKQTDGTPQSNLPTEGLNPNSQHASVSSDVAMYPNPAIDFITLDISSIDLDYNHVSYRIIALTGETLIQNQLGAQGIVKVNISQLQSGMYTVQVFDKSKIYKNQRLIKI